MSMCTLMGLSEKGFWFILPQAKGAQCNEWAPEHCDGG